MRTTLSFTATSAYAVLATRSVVRMARDAAAKPSSDNPAASAGTLSTISDGSSSTPITPVDDGITWFTGTFNCLATARQQASATFSPVRVAQLALPAFTSTALTLPLDSARCLRPITTGAACTRFCVKTAAADAGLSETIKARSSRSALRIPAYRVE